MPTLVDDFIPRPDTAERHSIVINASRDRVWQALTHLDPEDIRLAKPLVRRPPPVLPLPRRPAEAGTRPPSRRWPWTRCGRSSWGRSGSGGVWAGAEHTPAIGDADDFRAFDRPGYAKGTFSFRLDDAGPGRIRLVTETRVLATSPDARRAFRRYWIFIRLGSGLIRRIILSAIRARS